MRELLGIDREILLAYSPFPDLQARTIALRDEAAADASTRLDPGVSVLVCQDTNTRAKVQEYLVRNPERLPIVALSIRELRAITDLTKLREVFIQQHFSRDLFALESPIEHEAAFFGRQEIVTTLVDRFRAGQNSGLFGLRRMGKTSVLHAVGRRCERGGLAAYFYRDLSNPALYGQRWGALLGDLAHQMADSMALSKTSRRRLPAKADFAEHAAPGLFKDSMAMLTSVARGNRILIGFDEIENITFDLSPATHWAEEFLPFWQTLRATHQDLRGAFAYLIAGVNPHPVEKDRIGNFDNPLFSTTRAFFLEPFDKTVVGEMVDRIGGYMGLQCDPRLFSALHAEYGGHPFLIRQACSRLADEVPRPGRLTLELFEEDREAIALALEKNVRQILNVLGIWYPIELELLTVLARGEDETFSEFAMSSAEFTEHVEGYGLVSSARTSPAISIGIVKKYLAKQVMEPSVLPAEGGEIARVSLDTEDRLESVLAEISLRRNGIERRLRGVVHDALLFAHGARAAQKALSSIPEGRRASLMQFGYDDVWDNLYFDELRQIALSNWDALQNYFAEDSATVDVWLDHINRSRSDAHARNLSEEDLAYLRVCFVRMEQKLGLAQ